MYHLTNPKNRTTSLRRKAVIFFFIIFTFYTLFYQYKVQEIPFGVLGTGALLLGTAVYFYIAEGKRNKSVFPREVTYLLLFMLAALLFGIVTSPQSSYHMNRWVTSFEYFCVMAALVLMTDHIEYLEKLAFYFSIFSLFCAVVLMISPVQYRDTAVVMNIRYSLSTSLNPNTLGTYFMLGTWCTLFLVSINKKHGFFSCIYILVMLYAIILTGSRKHIISFLIVVIMWSFLVFYHANRRNSLKIIGAFVLSIIVGYFFIVKIYDNSTMALRMDNLFDIITNKTESSRINMYEYGWNLIKKHPFIGIGFDGFSYYYGGYSHATLVEMPVSTGIIGSILYFGIYLYSIMKTIKLIRMTNHNSKLQRANMLLRNAFVLWSAMLFLTTGVIHAYLLISYISFGFIFSAIKNAENEIKDNQKNFEMKREQL